MKKLVIVESPSKSKTIEKYLGTDYKVLSSKGHIRDLATTGKLIHFLIFQQVHSYINLQYKKYQLLF